MRLYLHIGLSKTGTGAIQTLFCGNREILLKELKILYPQTGIPIASRIIAHHFLAFSLFEPNKAKSISLNTSFEDYLNTSFEDYMDQMKKEIDETKPEKVVISSEYFMLYKDEPILEKFNHFLNNLFEEIYILVYLRRQDLWQESSYSQGVKDHRIRRKTIFKEYVGYSKNRDWLLMYDKFLSRWKTFFPKAKIIPRIYDRKALPNGDVIKDFLSILGIEYGKFESSELERNPSLSRLSTLALREINEKFDLTREEHVKIVQYLFKLDKEEGSPLKTFFTLQERIEFLEYFRESNERLFSEWFNCENKFVLSEEEIKFYEEQDRILREDAEKMVEDRYRKVLAYLMEEKITPRVNITFTQKPEIMYYPIEEVEFMVVDVLQVDLLKKGRMNIGGLVLLKKEVEGDYRLIIRDGEGEKEVKWGLPSPGLSSRYPDNLKAKDARFEVKNIIIRNKIELFLSYDNDSKRLIEIELV